MKFTETPLQGAYLITPDLLEDERGFFARSFCRHEFTDHGLNADFVQCNISFNKMKGTLRGMHYQISPHEEVKLVRCTAGAIYDVIIDLRAESPTFMKWFAVELTAENHKLLYIPKRFAHGFQTLSANTELSYHHSSFFSPECSRGLRFDDPILGIKWPLSVGVISVRDQNYPPMDNSFEGIEL